MDIQILHGLPPALIGQAAGLYADAFAHYFAVTASVHQHRKQLIEQAIKPEHAFVAVADNSTLLGVAGYRHGDKRFLRLGFRAIVAQLGWYRGIVGGVMLSYLDRPVGRGQLVMDGIAVTAASRGLGIGTRLLESLIGYASDQGLHEIRLDVVDTNPLARKLYERVGFVEVGRTKVPAWFARRVGFHSSATLTRVNKAR